MEEDIQSTLETLHDGEGKWREKDRMRGVTEGERRGEEGLENYEGLCCISQR